MKDRLDSSFDPRDAVRRAGWGARGWGRWLGCVALVASVALAAGRSDAEPESARAGATAESSGPARPFLWRVETRPPSYLFGTVHLPDERVLALPGSVTRALGAADVVYTEVDMGAEAQERAAVLMFLPAGESLASVLPEDLYQRLEGYLSARGVPLALMQRFKVWALSTTLPLLDRMAEMQARPPLDRVLAQRATELGKETGALETVDEQIAVLESMGRDGEIAMLRQTLDHMERAQKRGEDPIEELILAYLSGSSDRLLRVSQQYLDRDDPISRQVEDAVLYQRNVSMTETIRKRLAERPEEAHFFAVGALHYPGERGIVALLRAQGLEVTRVEE